MASVALNLRDRVAELVEPGSTDLGGRALWALVRTLVMLLVAATNVIGAAVVVALAVLVLPLPTVPDVGHVRLVNGVAAAIYVLVAVPLGAYIGARRMRGVRDWLRADRPATASEQRTVLRAPLRLFWIQITLWLIAAIGFGALNATYSGQLALWVSSAVVLSGLTTAACAYLLSERALRPIAARALAEGSDAPLAGPGVTTRFIFAWALGTTVPVLGILVIGIAFLGGIEAGGQDLAIAMVVLGGTAIAVGFLAILLAARATAAPVNAVRRALARVQDGDFDANVRVYDGTQIGDLQVGFNEMVAGLAERERIREAFGTYVDPDVAEQVMEEGTDLQGEQVEVTILFADVRDFTAFAEKTPAPEVVALLNGFFERAVPIVHDEGGRVDKFTGDGLMAVFGAPRRLESHADRALAAAFAIGAAAGELDGLEIGIGLNSGTVVAGNVGGGGRLEFSVIGDAVNVAARAEAATRETDDAILLTEATKAALTEGAAKLTERPNVSLKGKSEPIALYAAERPAGT